MKKTTLLACAFSLLTPVAGAALADSVTTPTLNPLYGDLDPFYGDLDPFYGDINPFWGSNRPPAYGDLDPFYGDINPFYGDINPFWGDIDPFWGDIDPFARSRYGDLDPFWGDIDPFYGDIDAFWGDIDPFWGEIGPLYGDIDAFWGDIDAFSDASSGDYQQLLGDLNTLVSQSESVWGERIEAQTGRSFGQFADGIFARYGIDLNDSATLDGVSASQRSMLFLDWYDGLMAFSGVDSVDHWMATANWTPALTQIQGERGDVLIGLLDASVHNHADLTDNLVYVGGYDSDTAGHGAGVVSLLVAEHDGKGVMGIAPNADVAAYNPFDETGTASWADVETGVETLAARGASVINMSLGVSGWTLHGEWSDIFANTADAAEDSIFVLAAGNDSVTQPTDIDWDFSSDAEFLVVGSVNPVGRISAFSNTPGEACLLSGGSCDEANKLKYRFLVAPGELILVADGEGGVIRRSGTSFAAPLVSGAIALLHDRWPWLKDYKAETADIILQSAKDLGAPGVDGIYGWGLLDVEASQSPLSFDDLVWYQYKKGEYKEKNVNAVRNAGDSQRNSWESKGMHFYAYEYIGETHRDFAIPLSSKLIGQTIDIDGVDQRFQNYLYDRMTDWMDGAHFSDVTRVTAPLSEGDDWRFGVTVSSASPYRETPENRLPFQTGFVMEKPASGMTLQFGFGEGAMALSGQEGFGLFSDYDASQGGANPVLGLASGGAYVGGSYDITGSASLDFGFTETSNERLYTMPWSGEQRPLIAGLENYNASAMNFGMSYNVGQRAKFGVAYTQLNEQTGLLGIQGLDPITLDGGSVTDAATFSGGYDVTPGLQIAASVTMGRTRAGSLAEDVLAVTAGGLKSTAFALAATRTGIIGKSDRMRLSMAQPLRVNSGELEYTSVQVVDRQTGEIGAVTERFGIASERSYVFEALYAMPVLKGRGEVSAFGQMDTAAGVNGQSGVTGGVRLGFGF